MLQHFGKWSVAAAHRLATIPVDGYRCFSIDSVQPAAQQATTNHFHVQVILKSFELKYVQQASIAVRDLLLLNFAPKSKEVLPDVKRPEVPSNLIMTVGEVAIPQRIAKYTVIRSPHVDKASRDQFEKRVHKRCINISTVSPSELYWFVQHLKLYEFLGVQIQVNVSSRQYLVPPAEISAKSILSKHREACSTWYATAALQPAPQTPAKLIQEAVNKLQNTVQAATPVFAADSEVTTAAVLPRRMEFQGILDSCNSVLLSLDSSGLSNSKLLMSRFGAVSSQQPDLAMWVHNVMKLGLWLTKLQQLKGEKDALHAMEFCRFSDAACQTLLDAYFQQQLYITSKDQQSTSAKKYH